MNKNLSLAAYTLAVALLIGYAILTAWEIRHGSAWWSIAFDVVMTIAMCAVAAKAGTELTDE